MLRSNERPIACWTVLIDSRIEGSRSVCLNGNPLALQCASCPTETATQNDSVKDMPDSVPDHLGASIHAMSFDAAALRFDRTLTEVPQSAARTLPPAMSRTPTPIPAEIAVPVKSGPIQKLVQRDQLARTTSEPTSTEAPTAMSSGGYEGQCSERERVREKRGLHRDAAAHAARQT